MTSKKTSMTAAQLMATLKGDQTWVERQTKLESERACREAGSVTEQKELLRDLAQAGHQVVTVWDLVNTNKDYKSAIPVLLDHLSRPYSVGIREGIVRALTVDYTSKWNACAKLIDEYKRLNDNSENGLKWVIGNAISVVATPDCAAQVINIATDPTNGRSRDMIILRLPRLLGKDIAKPILMDLVHDLSVNTNRPTH